MPVMLFSRLLNSIDILLGKNATMPQTTPASDRVLHTVELVETILLQLPAHDILRARRSNKRIYSIVKGSKNLQERLFLDVPAGHPTKRSDHNPFLLAPAVAIGSYACITVFSHPQCPVNVRYGTGNHSNEYKPCITINIKDKAEVLGWGAKLQSELASSYLTNPVAEELVMTIIYCSHEKVARQHKGGPVFQTWVEATAVVGKATLKEIFMVAKAVILHDGLPGPPEKKPIKETSAVSEGLFGAYVKELLLKPVEYESRTYSLGRR